MYPGLASLLQQLAADPTDELLAARIVSLLQDIPDGEYRVDQLLAASQMLLAASPRLGLICAHAAYRSAPDRVEALAIAEEALSRLGRRAKVEVLRKERKRLDAENRVRPVVDPTVSKLLLDESGGLQELPENAQDVDIKPDEGTVLIRPGETESPVKAALSGAIPNHDSLSDPSVNSNSLPGWWTAARVRPGFAANYDALLELCSAGIDEISRLIKDSDSIAALPGDSLLEAVEKLPDVDLHSAVMTLMVVDAVIGLPVGSTIRGADPHELVAGLLAGMLGRMNLSGQQTTLIQEAVSLRLPILPARLQAGLALALKRVASDERPEPSFTTTTL
jgi:hypothetical protein